MFSIFIIFVFSERKRQPEMLPSSPFHPLIFLDNKIVGLESVQQKDNACENNWVDHPQSAGHQRFGLLQETRVH